MAWNPSPKVADCRDVARKWKKQVVIILAIDVNANTSEYASYGETRFLCDKAKELADAAHEAIERRIISEVAESKQAEDLELKPQPQ